MTQRPTQGRDAQVGGGYLRAPVRIEHRPGLLPAYPTRAEMLRLLEEVVASGARAWWYSCAAKGSYPLFPSRYLEHVPEAEEGLFEWFTEQCHRRGVAIMSWEYLSTAPLTTRAHPEWRMQFLQPVEGQVRGRVDRHREVYGDQNPCPCFNSPYGELLMDYCVEVIEELGFDGLWFDGCFMGPANTWPGGRIGCRCPRCERRFRDETGLDMPAFEDRSDPVFRRFIQWRQRFFADYWSRLCQHLRAHSPTGLIGLNNFNRWPHPTGFGCPLNEVGFDGLSCAEISQQPWQAPLMLQYLRQVSDRYPPELWIHRTPPGPSGDPEQMTYFGELCMAGGGFHSEGHPLSPGHNSAAIREAVRELTPRAEYVGGEAVRFAGIVLSSNTKDFAFEGDDRPTWRSVHGIHNLLLDAHWPCEVVLDNQVRLQHLRALELVILPDVRCLSDEQADALAEYVRGGGTLLVTAHSGMLDDIGRPRRDGALDALMGVTRRDAQVGVATAMALEGRWAAELPDVLRVWPDDRSGDLVEPELPLPVRWADDIEVMARGVRLSEDPAGENLPEGRAIVAREVGEGRVIFIDRDLGGLYAGAAWPDVRRLLTGALARFVEPQVRIEAAPHVAVTVWRQHKRDVVHVLSRPHQLRVVEPVTRVDLSGVPPAGDISVEVPWRVKSATRPVTGGPVSVKIGRAGSLVRATGIGRHDVIVLRSSS